MPVGGLLVLNCPCTWHIKGIVRSVFFSVPLSTEQLPLLHQIVLYNKIHIHKDDERKIDISTTRGHYEYLVMLYRLVNTPFMFQVFICDVLCDMLD